MYRKPFKPPLLKRRSDSDNGANGFDRSYGVVNIARGGNRRQSDEKDGESEGKKRPFKKMKMSEEEEDGNGDLLDMLRDEIDNVVANSTIQSRAFQRPKILNRPASGLGTKEGTRLERKPLSTIVNPATTGHSHPSGSADANQSLFHIKNSSFVKPTIQPKQDSTEVSVDVDSYYLVLWQATQQAKPLLTDLGESRR
jgi:hypothetical protein